MTALRRLIDERDHSMRHLLPARLIIAVGIAIIVASGTVLVGSLQPGVGLGVEAATSGTPIVAATSGTPIVAARQLIAYDAIINDVTQTASGFVAVGRSSGAKCCNAISWTSTDGHTWTRAPGLRNAEMFSVASIGSRIVAVGVDYGLHAGAVWTSTTGRTWSRVSTGTLFASTWLRDVVADGNRFAAAGTRFRGAVDFTEPKEKIVGSRIWVSSTGSSWSYLSGTSTVLVGSRVHTLLSVSNGLVAAGDFGWPLGQQYAAAWSSPLNRGWLPAEDYPTVRPSSVGGLGVAGDRIIAFGTRGAAYSLLSEYGIPDRGRGGRHWKPLIDPTIPGETLCPTTRNDRAAVGQGANGVVAVAHGCGESGLKLAWSRDGVAWSTAPLDLQDEPVAMALIRGPDGLILVGFTTFAADSDALIWLIPDPTA